MKSISQTYINGEFRPSSGSETLDLINPANKQTFGSVRLATQEDALLAIQAAKQAFPSFSVSSREERMQYLQNLHDAVIERLDDLKEATLLEYGATTQRALWSNRYAAEAFLNYKAVLADFEFERTIGTSQVVLTPLGVTAILTAWNSNAGSVCVKLAAIIIKKQVVLLRLLSATRLRFDTPLTP